MLANEVLARLFIEVVDPGLPQQVDRGHPFSVHILLNLNTVAVTNVQAGCPSVTASPIWLDHEKFYFVAALPVERVKHLNATTLHFAYLYEACLVIQIDGDVGAHFEALFCRRDWLTDAFLRLGVFEQVQGVYPVVL